jgi:hypothetical protein
MQFDLGHYHCRTKVFEAKEVDWAQCQPPPSVAPSGNLSPMWPL